MPYVATRGGPSSAAPADGSRTITLRDSQPIEDGGNGDQGEAIGALQLTGGRTRREQRVVWSEDVVDNEGAGKKSSKSRSSRQALPQARQYSYAFAKVCCIYHKPRRFDESSSEESSDSDSDSSCGHDHHTPNRRRARRNHEPSENGEGGSTRSRDPGDSTVHELEDGSGERNMYERVPRGKPKGKGVARK
ncbi:hypothetical protein NLI96_g5609 [Meripilus lineatus]|uniref:Type 1 phosphatases regulator n=1 Tax=Meripilus lineatus TaxID=2056292 RepID=A0AAD5YDR4_9APHY|nr:hypothetical protein NLI96_g5609 [Physisporinus lineatus]